jgi:hypothetical protein
MLTPAQVPAYTLVCGHDGQEPYRIRGAETLDEVQRLINKYQARTEFVSRILVGTPNRICRAGEGVSIIELTPILRLMCHDGVWIDLLSAAHCG